MKIQEVEKILRLKENFDGRNRDGFQVIQSIHTISSSDGKVVTASQRVEDNKDVDEDSKDTSQDHESQKDANEKNKCVQAFRKQYTLFQALIGKI